MYQLDLEGQALLMSSPDIKGEQGIALQNGQFLTLSVSDWPCLGTILCMYENAPAGTKTCGGVTPCFLFWGGLLGPYKKACERLGLEIPNHPYSVLPDSRGWTPRGVMELESTLQRQVDFDCIESTVSLRLPTEEPSEVSVFL